MNDQLLIRVGKKIRAIRRQQNVKLHELAEEAQISKGLLSKIENGRTVPSLPVLISIIQTLKINISTFFEGIEMPQQAAYLHRKKTDYEQFEKEEAFGFIYHFILNHNIANLMLEAVILELLPGSKREPVTTDGYEFKYVLKGEVEYQLGDEKVVLQQGDSLFFHGQLPHVPVNKTDQIASMLVIYLLMPDNAS